MDFYFNNQKEFDNNLVCMRSGPEYVNYAYISCLKRVQYFLSMQLTIFLRSGQLL